MKESFRERLDDPDADGPSGGIKVLLPRGWEVALRRAQGAGAHSSLSDLVRSVMAEHLDAIDAGSTDAGTAA